MSDYITRNDVAQMCEIQPRYVSEVLEKRQDFPRPALVLTQKIVRWARVDVMTLARISRHKDLKILLAAYYRESPEQIAARL